MNPLQFFSNLLQTISIEVPYQAYLPAGTKAFSKPGGIDWGIASGGVVTIGAIWLGHSRVDFPLWDNGKPFWVPVVLQEYVPDEPPPPDPPDPDPTIFITHTIQVYSNGSIRIDGIYYAG